MVHTAYMSIAELLQDISDVQELKDRLAQTANYDACAKARDLIKELKEILVVTEGHCILIDSQRIEPLPQVPSVGETRAFSREQS